MPRFFTLLPRRSAVTEVGQPKPFYVSATSSKLIGEPMGPWRAMVDGYLSPLGAAGPGSGIEGVGTVTATGPSGVIRAAAQSNTWRESLATGGAKDLFADPRSPLSDKGALNKEAYDAAMAPLLRPIAFDFFFGGVEVVAATKQLEPGGRLGIAGRGGINNNAGWMGMLGPTGAYPTRGLRINDAGDYINAQGKIVREIPDVAWAEGETRALPLVEHYTAQRAAALSKQGKLDASWLVQASLAKAGDAHTYKFTAPAGEVVNVLVSAADPNSHRLLKPSDFGLELLNAKGELLANSIERNGLNWLQLFNAEKTKLQVRVTLFEPATAGEPTKYTLKVNGATDRVKPDPVVEGPHQLGLGTIAITDEWV
jgi:hypothetical protein